MSTFESLLQRPDLWRLRDHRPPGNGGFATGHAALDDLLRDGGWPPGALVELLQRRPGIGEWQLLGPWLGEVSRRGSWQLWVDPPLLPFAPALLQGGLCLERVVIVRTASQAQWLWCCDQALRAAGCAAVVSWAARPLRYADLRKLQVAAGERRGIAFLLRGQRAAASASPAALRLSLACSREGLVMELLKQRGSPAGQRVLLPPPPVLQPQTPLRDRPCVVSAARPRAQAAVPPPASEPSREVVWQ